MLKSKALYILRSFSSEEMKEFRVFLSSPYFNTNTSLIKFFDVLVKFYPGFDDANFTKEYIFEKLYPETPFKDEVLRNFFSRLLALGEDYLRLKAMENDTHGKEVYLIGELSKRKIGSLFDKNVQKLEKLLPEKDTSGDSYLVKFRIETEKFNYNLSNVKISGPTEIEEDMEILKKRGEYLINFFILSHLKEMDFLQKFSNLYNTDINDTLPVDFNKRIKLIDLLDYMRKRKAESSIIYEIYYNLIKAFEDFNDMKYYKDLKKLLIKNADSFIQEDKHFLFGKLIDYGIIKTRREPDGNFDDEHFSNYVLYLENEYYLHSKNDHLPLDLFRNILILALRKRDFDWTEKFINNYIKKLKKDYQENTYHYAMAFLYFQKGEYEKALSEINQVAYDLFTFKYDVRNLNLMICYELENWENVRSIIESYKRFLLNNKLVSKDRKEFHGNFIKYLNKLAKIRSDVNKIDKVERDFLREEVLNTKNFSYKEWMIEKIDSLSSN